MKKIYGSVQLQIDENLWYIRYEYFPPDKRNINPPKNFDGIEIILVINETTGAESLIGWLTELEQELIKEAVQKDIRTFYDN